jgi:hypothetical protein
LSLRHSTAEVEELIQGAKRQKQENENYPDR